MRICPLNGYWSRVQSWDMNVPFMNLLILLDRVPYTISKLSVKYQLCAVYTADNTDGKVRIVRRLSADCPPNVRRLSTISEKDRRLGQPCVARQ